MDYFQGVVVEYLRADRACFINPEFWLRGNELKPYNKPHWYVDALAIHMKQRCAYLCEVTYAKKAPSLIKRLQSWRENWAIIQKTLIKDAGIPETWSIRPWIFTTAEIRQEIEPAVLKLHDQVRFTNLESVLPWLYKTWDRIDDEPPLNVDHSVS
jgi:hypothetical protein